MFYKPSKWGLNVIASITHERTDALSSKNLSVGFSNIFKVLFILLKCAIQKNEKNIIKSILK